jgi:hypothetical protein
MSEYFRRRFDSRYSEIGERGDISQRLERNPSTCHRSHRKSSWGCDGGGQENGAGGIDIGLFTAKVGLAFTPIGDAGRDRCLGLPHYPERKKYSPLP